MVALKSPPLRKAKFIGRTPGDVADHMERSIDLYGAGDYVAALQEWDWVVLKRQEDASAHLGRALILLQMRRFQEALESLEASSKLAVPADMKQDLHLARAVALHALGQNAATVEELNEALDLGYSATIAELRRSVIEERLHELVKEGFAFWSGRRPKGSKHPVRISPGPPVSDYVIQDRG